MLRIARELSETEARSFSIFEDDFRQGDEKPCRRHIEVQTEISCDHVSLSTEVSISSARKTDPDELPDVVFWRAVATQRASELDAIREEITKIREMTINNIMEKRRIDKKYDDLYNQLQKILQNSEGDEDSGTREEEQLQSS